MTLAERIARAAEDLRRAGVPADEAPGDADVLARHVLGWDLARLGAERRGPPPDWFEARYAPLLERRARREPVSHIVGHREFWGMDFLVTSDVLTPRPETELIVEEALEAFPRRDANLIVDVGTGSGCLAIALAREFRNARVVATDISLASLAVARRNAEAHDVYERIEFLHIDLLPPVPGIDLVVSNPPYVPSAMEGALPPEVGRYEPHVALFAGEDGMDAYRRLMPAARRHVRPDGILIVEVGYDQAGMVSGIAAAAGWHLVKVRHDLQNIPRTLVLKPEA